MEIFDKETQDLIAELTAPFAEDEEYCDQLIKNKNKMNQYNDGSIIRESI